MENQTYSTEIVNAIKDYLDNDDWKYTFDEDDGTFQFKLRIDGPVHVLEYTLWVEDDRYYLYASINLSVDPDDHEKMLNMAEFICRATAGIINGNFEFNMENGEICYKTFVNCKGIHPTDDIIASSIYAASGMFERYMNGICDIIFRNVPAKEAAEACDRAVETDDGE